MKLPLGRLSLFMSRRGKQIMSDVENDGGSYGMGEDGNLDHEMELKV